MPITPNPIFLKHPSEPLSGEEEYQLALLWRDKKQKSAFDRLITGHLRMVHKLAHKYRGYQLDHEDLVSEGVLGLIHAAEKFDVSRGFRFSTYALWHVRASMQRFILSNWSIVKTGTTTSQRKLFFNLRRMLKELDQENHEKGKHPDQYVAETLNVSLAEVISMRQRLFAPDISLNCPTRNSADVSSLQDVLPHPHMNTAETVERELNERHLKKTLYTALDSLPDRERFIIEKRHLCEGGMKLKAIARIFGISAERSRQLEKRALKLLREFLLGHGVKATNLEVSLPSLRKSGIAIA